MTDDDFKKKLDELYEQEKAKEKNRIEPLSKIHKSKLGTCIITRGTAQYPYPGLTEQGCCNLFKAGGGEKDGLKKSWKSD